MDYIQEENMVGTKEETPLSWALYNCKYSYAVQLLRAAYPHVPAPPTPPPQLQSRSQAMNVNQIRFHDHLRTPERSKEGHYMDCRVRPIKINKYEDGALEVSEDMTNVGQASESVAIGSGTDGTAATEIGDDEFGSTHGTRESGACSINNDKKETDKSDQLLSDKPESVNKKETDERLGIPTAKDDLVNTSAVDKVQQEMAFGYPLIVVCSRDNRRHLQMAIYLLDCGVRHDVLYYNNQGDMTNVFTQIMINYEVLRGDLLLGKNRCPVEYRKYFFNPEDRMEMECQREMCYERVELLADTYNLKGELCEQSVEGLQMLFIDIRQLLEKMLVKGVNVNIRLRYNDSLLRFLVLCNDMVLAERLVETHNVNMSLPDRDGYNALMLLSTHYPPKKDQVLSLCRTIIHTTNVDINRVNIDYQSALYHAFHGGFPELAILLLHFGADENGDFSITYCDTKGSGALEWAFQGMNPLLFVPLFSDSQLVKIALDELCIDDISGHLFLKKIITDKIIINGISPVVDAGFYRNSKLALKLLCRILDITQFGYLLEEYDCKDLDLVKQMFGNASASLQTLCIRKILDKLHEVGKLTIVFSEIVRDKLYQMDVSDVIGISFRYQNDISNKSVLPDCCHSNVAFCNKCNAIRWKNSKAWCREVCKALRLPYKLSPYFAIQCAKYEICHTILLCCSSTSSLESDSDDSEDGSQFMDEEDTDEDNTASQFQENSSSESSPSNFSSDNSSNDDNLSDSHSTLDDRLNADESRNTESDTPPNEPSYKQFQDEQDSSKSN